MENIRKKKHLYRIWCSVMLMLSILCSGMVNSMPAAAEEETVTEPSLEVDFNLLTEYYNGDGLTLYWYSSGNHTGFHVYRKAEFQSEYELLGTVKNISGSALELTDTEFRLGFEFSYQIVAYQVLADGEELELESYGVSYRYSLGKVELKSVKRLQKVNAKLSWKKISGADGYEIYKKTAGGTYRRVKMITDPNTLTYTLENVSTSKATYYKVRAYVSENGKYAYGPFSTQEKLSKTTVSKLAAKFRQLMKKYPDGKYWNHVGKTTFDSNTITNQPCHHSVYTDISDTCNYYSCPDGVLGYQCYGFAWKMSDLIYGRSAKIKNFYSFSKCRAGDVIRYSGHSVIIVSKHAGYVTVGECNYGNTCIIKWGRKVYESELYGAKYSRRYA